MVDAAGMETRGRDAFWHGSCHGLNMAALWKGAWVVLVGQLMLWHMHALEKGPHLGTALAAPVADRPQPVRARPSQSPPAQFALPHW